MTRVDNRVVIQRVYLLFYRLLQSGEIASRQVRSTNASRKQRVAHKYRLQILK